MFNSTSTAAALAPATSRCTESERTTAAQRTRRDERATAARSDNAKPAQFWIWRRQQFQALQNATREPPPDKQKRPGLIPDSRTSSRFEMVVWEIATLSARHAFLAITASSPRCYKGF